jgi:lipid A 3-O-deacylase
MISFLRCLVLFTCMVHGQEKKTFEIGITLDNDSFSSIINDKYYTNGMEIFGNYISKKTNQDVFISSGFKIGQYIYNPKSVKSDFKDDHNRPYSGYLFAEFNQSKFYKNQTIWITKYQMGIVGPSSQAEEFQKWMHNAFGFGKLYGWQHQIKNTVALQYNTIFSSKIFDTNSTNKIDFHWQSKAEIGTAFSGITTGIVSRISLSKNLKSMQQSNFYNSLLFPTESKSELYLYFLPKINIQFYDATLQGSLFDDKSPLTFNPSLLRFKLETGLKYRIENWNFNYIIHYTTQEIKNNSVTGFYYGSIGISSLF